MDNTEMISVNNEEVSMTLSEYEKKMLEYIEYLGLPTNGILVPIDERKKIIKNFDDIVCILKSEDLGEAKYISKFFVAAAAGLFDAALNYMWDETVFQLRKRIENYDIEYFYDVAVLSEKRKKLSGVKDLPKLDDSELIKGAREIDMISDVGYNHLDYIKYMRNWASAAHPNQTNVTGLQLISWLETCIKEVINLPNSKVTVEIGRFLNNIKAKELSSEEINAFKSFLGNLTIGKINNLASGLFGIYYRVETEMFTRKNVQQLFPIIWKITSEETKNEFGIKYARFVVNGDTSEAIYCKELLELVDGLEYLPDEIRTTELANALDQLIDAHNGINNFYREPTFALQLSRVAGNKSIPSQVNRKYVYIIVDCFIGNGYGTCWDADTIYKELINRFNQDQINIAAFTILDEHIAGMLQHQCCEIKYRELLESLYKRNTVPVVKDLIELINNSPIKLHQLRKDASYKQQIETKQSILL